MAARLPGMLHRVALGFHEAAEVGQMFQQRSLAVLLKRTNESDRAKPSICCQLGQHLLTGSFVGAERHAANASVSGLVLAVPNFGLALGHLDGPRGLLGDAL